MPNINLLTKPENAKLPFEIINMESATDPARINIYDIIGQTWWEDGVVGKAFSQEVNALGKTRDLNVHINSLGGDVVDGTLIYSTLQKHQGKVNVIIDGWAVSMASVIAMAGDTVEMSSMGMIMIHKPLNGCYGNADDMQKNIELLDKVEGALSTAYINKTGLSSEEIANMLTAETWMTASEALEHGFIDSISLEVGTAPSNCLSKDIVNKFKNTPKLVLDIVNDGNNQTEDELDDSASEQEEPDSTNESEQSKDTNQSTNENTSTTEGTNELENIDPAAVENNRVIEIMNRCEALGLSNMAKELIENKSSIETAGLILSTVKAGLDSNSATTVITKSSTDLDNSWGDAFNQIK